MAGAHGDYYSRLRSDPRLQQEATRELVWTEFVATKSMLAMRNEGRHKLRYFETVGKAAAVWRARAAKLEFCGADHWKGILSICFTFIIFSTETPNFKSLLR